MTEQSDNTPNDLGSASLAGEEPTMEDILASIRKIISEDEPVAMESPEDVGLDLKSCLLYTSPSPRDATLSRMPSSA